MKKIFILMMFIFAIGTLSVFSLEGMELAEDKDYFTPVFVPEGDARKGKEVFLSLQCNSCHEVLGNPDVPKPITSVPGPALGKLQAESPMGWLLNSIVSPSHGIGVSEDGKIEGGQLSRMGDFTEAMTVRQLIDLVSFLRSVEEN